MSKGEDDLKIVTTPLVEGDLSLIPGMEYRTDNVINYSDPAEAVPYLTEDGYIEE